ncbi:hypothetical protein [Methylosinus sp. Ce-a6]|uniref:hypothetical protein n=1 Tax=Methylosinus sp. Ce-a6 TaxID=2172005 RepID=UPI0013595046|nr:hypothetical protein [Methylosinus sp. Ce-a6]
MKIRFIELCLIALAPLAVSSTPAAPAQGKPGVQRAKAGPKSMKAEGDPRRLRLEGDALRYCDLRGAREISLKTGGETASGGACPAAAGEGDTSCGGVGKADVDVRTPPGSPDDFVDVGGVSVRVDGHVEDCVRDGSLIAVAAGSSVVVIDLDSGKSKTLDRDGADRVAISKDWVAWSSGATIKWLAIQRP